ncbi:hypothetical protein K2173_005749 [Erythroxylum novogranatense]|uniref:Uncharacterized protein n=1 Tax=Erythroxylum novogranatense TaxID=1862640 RepID=A0AAV8U2V0_9ROSI|nr:hypothetical protein K2173_005749 [Erythroxylum novogranatense]
MLIGSLLFPMLISTVQSSSFTPDFRIPAPTIGSLNSIFSAVPLGIRRGSSNPLVSRKKCVLHCTVHIGNISLNNQEKESWQACREALSAFDLSVEEKDKMLAKAFGHIHSPYWSEERKQKIPKLEIANEILDYLRSLGLSNDDLYKLLKKFPEVLGCSLEQELRNNVKILETDWGISGKALHKLLLRNPKVLGYNVDCRGDCMAKCTRCWVRF